MQSSCTLIHNKCTSRYCSECGEIVNCRLTPLDGCEKNHEEMKDSGCNFCCECGEQLLPVCFEGKNCPNCNYEVCTPKAGMKRKFKCLTCQREFEL
ncbi:MAG: hypothetical protein PHN19_05065 [Patescibacteria group bacterium]|nr:hypothetical protein [Patescibacteria group bacterium]